MIAQAPDRPDEEPAAERDQNALTVEELAKGVLARSFQPRVATIRRLAEAVLAKASKPKKKKKKGGGKKRKLATIPGQKDPKKRG